MKKRVVSLVLILIIIVSTIAFLIPMINYVYTFSNMNSFMSLNNAIVFVVLLSCLLVLSLIFATIVIIQIVKIDNKKTKILIRK